MKILSISCQEILKMDLSILLGLVSFLVLNNASVAQSCSWPAMFTNTIWHDSNRDEVTFTDTTVSGWDVTASTVVEDWECYIVNETSATTLTLIFKARTTFEIFSITYVSFACLQMTLFSENAYYYYQMAEEEVRLGYDRVKVFEPSTIAANPPTENSICLSPGDSVAPITNEYHVIIRNDKTETAIRTCPHDYIGTHKYTVTDLTSTYCGSGDSAWDVCTSSDTMVFNYTLCSTVLAYSEQGIVNCVFDMANGDYHLLTVMTREITSTERFTCLLSYLAANGSMYVSQYPGSCTKSQTPFDVPTSYDGSITGLKMVLTDKESCVDPTTTTTSTTSTTTTSTTTTTTTTTTSTTTSTTSTTTTPTTTTTTTSPTTTTTTPTTTTTTPTTTTTTPTTTTTTPTTTTTTSTTTTTTPTTITTTTTTPATTTQKPSSQTVMYIAIVVGCIAGILLIILIVIIVKRFCCKEPLPRPKTPDLNIESLPHKTAGYGGIPLGLANAPRETTIIEEINPEKDVIMFPQAKTSDFKLTFQKTLSFVQNEKRRNSFPNVPTKSQSMSTKMSSVNVPIWETSPMPAVMPSKETTSCNAPADMGTSYVASSTQPVEVTKSVKVFDGIIMDETVNFALRYSSRMQNVKKDWYERRNSGTLSLMSEKTVIVPTVSDSYKNSSRRVSITDISETQILENGTTNSLLSPSNVLESFSDTGSCTNDMLVSPISEVSLPVSPTDSVKNQGQN